MSGLLLSASLLPLAARVEPDGLAASSLAAAADGLPASSYDALQDCARIWHDAREFTSVNRPRLLESYFTGVSAHAEKTPHTLLIHIGKAAGTSLLNFYSKNDCFGMKLPDAECQAPIGPFGFNKDSLNRRCCAPFFTEVHALPTSPMALQANPRVVVMLRDPVERFVSAFNTHACLRDALGHKKRMLDCMRVPKDASEDLTKTLFAINEKGEKKDRVKIGLVPFTSFVNIGSDKENESWMDREGQSPMLAADGTHVTSTLADGQPGSSLAA